MDEVKMAAVENAFKQWAFRLRHRDLVPADLRHLEMRFGSGGVKSHHRSAEDTETQGAGIELLAAIEQRLIPDADPEEGLAGANPLHRGGAESLAVHGVHAVVERAHTGQHHGMGLSELVRGRHAAHIAASGGQGLFNAPDVSGAIIKKREHEGELLKIENEK